MTSVDGLSEHDSVGGYGRGSGHTFLVPSVVNSGRESGKRKGGLEDTVDPG